MSRNSHLRPFARASAQPQYAPDITLNPIHLELHLDFDIPNKIALATAKWTIVCKNPASQELVLDGVDLNIDPSAQKSTTFNGGRITEDSHSMGLIRISVRTVTIRYSVINPVAGLYFGGPTELQPMRSMWSAITRPPVPYWLPCIDHSNIRTPLDVST